MANKKTEEAVDQKMPAAEESKPVSLEAVQAMIAQMLAEAKAEADRLMKEARKNIGITADPERDARMEAARLRGEELVKVKLFRDNDKYKDDVFVGFNGENCVIKRGEEVWIKRKFADVLEASQRQDYETAMLIEQKSGEWEKASANL